MQYLKPLSAIFMIALLLISVPATPAVLAADAAKPDLDEVLRKHELKKLGPLLLVEEEIELRRTHAKGRTMEAAVIRAIPSREKKRIAEIEASIRASARKIETIEAAARKRGGIYQEELANLNKQRDLVAKARVALVEAREPLMESQRAMLKQLDEIKQLRQTVTEKYEKLAADADVKAVMKSDKLRLGPHPLIRKIDDDIEKWEAKFGALRGVEVPIQMQGGVVWTDVTVGETKIRMVVDTGASSIVLPLEDADKMSDLKWGKEVRVTVADGRVVRAQEVTIPSVRVGAAEQYKVQGVVLLINAPARTNATKSADDKPAPAPTAPKGAPDDKTERVDINGLLGGSFLGKYKVEVDRSNLILRLLPLQQ